MIVHMIIQWMIVLFIVEAHAQSTVIPVVKQGFSKTSEVVAFEALCPTVWMMSPREFDFKDMERRLLCGDETADAIGLPWREIPANQAAYFMRGFLQARGYHRPEFIQDDKILFVRPGPLSRLEKFRVTGGPPTWRPPRRRLIHDRPLTPGLLDELEGWALEQIKNEGYPCADTEAFADPVTGDVEVMFQPTGEFKIIGGIKDTGDTGLRDGALDRYNAFKIGGIYRQKLITLTRRRTQDDGFLQALSLTPKCEPGSSVTLIRDVTLGPSRMVSVGVGATTDEGARFRATVRQNRIGESASSAEARANVSYLSQQINHQVADANFRWYYAPGEIRSYVEPSITFEHDAQSAYATQSVESKALHGWNREFNDGLFEVRLGPSYLLSRTFRGAGPSNSTILYVETTGLWMSHDYEFFLTSPRKGEAIEASVAVIPSGWGANFAAQEVSLTGHKLWPIFNYDPPLLILAVRFDLNAIYSTQEDIASRLPVQFLTFIGGENDLRGFDPGSLPRSGVGALSGATGSGEARLHKVIFRRADVFTFLDAGMLGQANFQLEKPVFLSPGLGFRWESPVGVFRVYYAERLALQTPEDQVPYPREFRVAFTFGEEF